jgi:hypothetical protein
MRELFWATGLGLALFIQGCGSDGSSGASGGAGGAGGNGSCESGGKGTLDVRIRIDTGVLADVSFTSSTGLQQDVVSNTKIALGAGQYTVTARRVTTMGLTVGRAFYPKPVAPICLTNGSTQIATIEYQREPGSQKLWFTGGTDAAHTGAFDEADLAASAEVTPSVTISGALQSSRAIAFDKSGNLWLADDAGSLSMYARDSLGASLTAQPDVVLSGDALCPAGIPCGPRALAFDNVGGLWVALGDRVSHFEAQSLSTTGEPLPDVTLTGPDLTAPSALAIDASDGLWVANSDGGVVGFSAAHLAADSDAAAEVVLAGQTPEPAVSALEGPAALAIDTMGALWVGYVASNVVARYEAELLAESATLTPSIQLSVEGLASPQSMAFDDSGSLWLGGGAGNLVSISAATLLSGADASADAIILTSADITSAVGLAFNPPAGGTPIAR